MYVCIMAYSIYSKTTIPALFLYGVLKKWHDLHQRSTDKFSSHGEQTLDNLLNNIKWCINLWLF